MPSMVKTGEVVPLYYDPGFNGESFYVPKQMEGLDIPPFQDFYEKIKGAKPSGKLWDMYLTSLSINSAMQRLLVLPPGAPQAAVDTLRAAVLRLNNDKTFAEDAQKVVGFVPEYSAASDTNRQVSNALTVSPEMRAAVAEYIKNGPKK